MIIELPGREPWRNIQQMRRELHARAVEKWKEERAERTRERAFLEDNTDWDNVREHVTAVRDIAETPTPDNDKLIQALSNALAATRPLPAPPEELNPAFEERLEGVEVKLVVHSKRAWVAITQLSAEMVGGAKTPAQKLMFSTRAIMMQIAATVADVRGLVVDTLDEDGKATAFAVSHGPSLSLDVGEDEPIEVPLLSGETIATLELAGLIGPLRELCNEVQRLDSDFRVGFGR